MKRLVCEVTMKGVWSDEDWCVKWRWAWWVKWRMLVC